MAENKKIFLSFMLVGSLLAATGLAGCEGKADGKAKQKGYVATTVSTEKIDSVRSQMKKPSLSGAACCAGSPSRGAALSKAGPGPRN